MRFYTQDTISMSLWPNFWLTVHRKGCRSKLHAFIAFNDNFVQNGKVAEMNKDSQGEPSRVSIRFTPFAFLTLKKLRMPIWLFRCLDIFLDSKNSDNNEHDFAKFKRSEPFGLVSIVFSFMFSLHVSIIQYVTHVVRRC